MDSHPHQDQNHFDNLLNHGFHDHGFESFPFHFPEELMEEQKVFTPTIKKKGRPKGLKTNKSKIQIKEEYIPGSKNSGHWLPEENKRYHRFLQIYSKHFIHKHMRRMDKIFKTMADFIGTREAQQCRSHHQKMQKKHHTFYKIIKTLRNQFYMSIDPAHVKADLQNNFIVQYDPLISEQTLENERQPQPQQNNQKEVEIHLEIEAEKPPASHNFFNDNYQSRFHYQNL